MLYFTSDHHFGHANIIDYSGRPFTDVGAMDSALIDAWNDTVAPGDEVWHLGDVAMGRRDETLRAVTRLHGHKTLVAGNHDCCWWGHRHKLSYQYWRDAYVACGFAAIVDGETTLPLAAHTVTLSHFPYRNDGPDDEKYAAYRPVDRDGWLLHGHVHERWRQRDRMINVGVDAWNYRPVSAQDIEALIAAGSSDVPVDAPLRVAA